MRTIMKIFATTAAAAAMFSCRHDGAPKESRYLVDEFADLKVMRYDVPGWDALTLRQKEYAYHLAEAAKAGRDITWDQYCKWNLPVRHAVEAVIENYDGDRESEDFLSFMVYAKRLFFSNGIHHHYSEDKIIPECPKEYFASLLDYSEVPAEERDTLLSVIYSPDIYPQRRSTSGDGDIVALSAVNFYDGVTRGEVERYYAALADPSDPRPVSWGLNTKVVKKDGQVTEEAWKVGGIYSPAIERICSELEKAAAVAENDLQKKALGLLVEYYRTGDLKLWDEFNVTWVQDTLGTVDFINGFIEDYDDPLGRKATWEGYVNIKDSAASARTEILSSNAQWFEDHSPVDPRFRKPVVKGVSAKVVNAVTLAGATYPSTPIGINLPNADWIRRDFGSKSVTIANITHTYDKAALEAPHNTLDEFGLYYIADPKLVELGILPDMEAYKAAYSSYIRNGIMVQFSRIEPGKKNTEAHMQNRKLIAEWCYEKGLPSNVIEKKVRQGKTYFVVNDFVALRSLFGTLLSEIQRIKSEGDYQAGKHLVETYAVNIDPDLHKEVLERYRALGLKPYGGFINPEIVPVVKDGRTVDYELVQAEGYLEQQLDYGRRYRTL